MRISSLVLVSAFVVSVTGQTLTYEFPSTGNEITEFDYYQVCVKGAKSADLITTNLQQEDFRYDISSNNFRNGDKMDGKDKGRFAVNIPDTFECKGGILFQIDSVTEYTNLDLTLKATLDDAESKLTVCAMYGGSRGNWPDSLPGLGFTESLKLFEKVQPHLYSRPVFGSSSYNPERTDPSNRVSTLCRDFVPGVDDKYFSEAEPLPATVSFTFPEIGDQRSAMGVCIKGAQLASATSTVPDGVRLEMSTRKFGDTSNVWWESYFWEEIRNTGYGMPQVKGKYQAYYREWTSYNPCSGALYLQPQKQSQPTYWAQKNGSGAAYGVWYSAADRERLAKNEITVEILPENNESSVEICALVSTSYSQEIYGHGFTYNWMTLEEDYGFTNYGSNTGIPGTFVFCKDDLFQPATSAQDPQQSNTGEEAPMISFSNRVTLKLQL